MFADLLDLVHSLSALIEEENDLLVPTCPQPQLTELIEAKLRLTGQLEAKLTSLARERPGWAAELTAEQRQRLASSVQVLIDASTVNAELLERQQALSAELVEEVAREVRRLLGGRSTIYGVGGMLVATDRSGSISVNTRL